MSVTEKWWSEKWRWLAAQKIGASYRRSLAGAAKLKPEFLQVEPGLIKVKIRTGKAKAAFIRISWRELSGAEWDRILDDMSSESLWLAQLLSGEIPPEAEEFFRRRGSLLLPESLDSLETDCSIHGPGPFCRHAAYAHLDFAAEIERDPFILFHFRGRGKEALGAGLRKAPEQQEANSKGGGLPVEAEPPKSGSGFWTSGAPLKGFAAHRLEGLPPDGFVDKLGPAPFHLKGENLKNLLQRLYAVSAAWAKEASERT